MRIDSRGFLLAGAMATLATMATMATVAAPLRAEDQPSPAWGAQDASLYRVSARGFTPDSSATPYESLFGSKKCLEGTCFFNAAITLPSGGRITTLTLEACDNDPTGYVTLLLFECPGPGQSCVDSGSVATGLAATPGCGYFDFELPISLTLDNAGNSYMLEAYVAGPNVQFWSGAVDYETQVSPAPALATFNDVPTDHPQFQFIEALARSGITAGCGGGGFCPDAALTRGQMAVFLSRALGLHWPR